MSACLARGAFIVSARRTPFGAFGGKLKDVPAVELVALTNGAAIEGSSLPSSAVDSVITGNVMHSSVDAIYIARHASLKAGVNVSVPALTVNRLCGSGFQTIVNAVQEIEVGLSKVVLTGAAENMSQAPHIVRGLRWGVPLGKEPKMEDSLWAGLTDAYCKLPMGVTAENLAKKYKISREECDQFALSSQDRWANANKNGYFEAEILPVQVKGKKGMETFTCDEHPRQTTIEKLGSLPTVFEENGTVTAGNASGICDGAASLVVVSEDVLKEQNLTPLARVVGYGIHGVDPTIMGIGPVDAIRTLLSRANMSLNDIDLIEVNEAFAPQCLAVIKELSLDQEKVNVNGGAIALGHPLAASGSRITTHLVHEMRRRGVKYSIGSACIGGGQGIALLLENTN